MRRQATPAWCARTVSAAWSWRWFRRFEPGGAMPVWRSNLKRPTLIVDGARDGAGGDIVRVVHAVRRDLVKELTVLVTSIAPASVVTRRTSGSSNIIVISVSHFVTVRVLRHSNSN